MVHEEPLQIECLACGEVRVVFGQRVGDTGECPRCRYIGWTYACDMDGTTKRSALAALAARSSQDADTGEVARQPLQLVPVPAPACSWSERRREQRLATRRAS